MPPRAPRAASSLSRIVQMRINSLPYDSSTSLCHLYIPPEPHRRRCDASADRVMVVVNLLLVAAGGFVLVITGGTPIVASVPVLWLCLDLIAGCFIALGILGVVATTKFTGLLYLHLVLMTTLQLGAAFTVGSVWLARVDIARIATAEMFLQQPEMMNPNRIASIERACDFYEAANGTVDDVNAWTHCWAALGQSHEVVLGESQTRYAFLIELCACVVLLLGMATTACDLGLAATTELCMVGAEAIVMVLGIVEAAFGVWVVLVAPSHSLGFYMLLIGSLNAAAGMLVALWHTKCAHRFRRQLPFVPMTVEDPADFARSRRQLQLALVLHLLLLLMFGIYTLQQSTLTSVRDFAYEFYCTHLPSGLLEVNAGPTDVVVARIRVVSADTAIASAVGLFALCAAVFTVLLLDRLSYYIPRLAVEDRDSVL